MVESNDTFNDDAFAAALKRTTTGPGATPELKSKVASLLRSGAPGAEGSRTPPETLRLPSRSQDRVLGLPRVWGIAAAIAVLLLGGAMLTYQLREFFPQRQKYDPVAAYIGSLVEIHTRTPDAEKVSTDLGAFQKGLPSAMPVASLANTDARFISARVDQLNGQLCYAVKYAVKGAELTLVTASVGSGYAVPNYDQVEDGTRLVGGDREGWLVCLMGDSDLDRKLLAELLDGVKLLPSPSTQPVSSALEPLTAACR